ncbi:Pre-mRNA splicing factor prp1 [Scheffersomyces coipomensis]|uniref:Pre-mRNA splicing factor prp1 n=1 Tax=Scheffersomyces coipomensis TaxID=1788519 RepID=UPI00315D7FC2
MERKAFLDQEPPPGYVAGIGRGATGFTSSADSTVFSTKQDYEDDEDDDNEDKQDFSTTDKSILSKAIGKNGEDEEADRIYDEIEKRLSSRKTSTLPLIGIQPDSQLSSTQEKFTDLKRSLANVTGEEWSSLPEAGDLTRRNKRSRLLEQSRQRTYAVPDSALIGAGSISSLAKTNFQSISDSRDKLLESQLDNLLPQKSDVSTIDLESLNSTNYANVKNVSKVRAILSSLRKTEPNKATSWIASARLEEEATNYTLAKDLIVEGCKIVPRDPDIWIESIRLHQKSSDDARLCKIIAAEGLQFNRKSERLWIISEELENIADITSRKRVIKKALESLPSNPNLWKRLIELEDNKEDVVKLLEKAVEFCPNNWDFWETWINILSYKEAKVTLNKARKQLSGDFQVWLAASKLEERENENIETSKLIKMMERAFKDNASVTENSLGTSDWLKQANVSESEGFPGTCNAIIINILKTEDLHEDNLQSWLNEAEVANSETHVLTAKFIYEYIIDKFPTNIDVWLKLFSSLKKGPSSKLDELFTYYQKSISLNSSVEILYLMFAKDKWILGNDIDGAKDILNSAAKILDHNENICLALVKLESKASNYASASKLLKQFVTSYPNSSARMWYKYIHLLRFLNYRSSGGKTDSVLQQVEQALIIFPDSSKLHLQKTQIYLNEDHNLSLARDSASLGTKSCPHCVELWILLSSIYEQMGVLIRARSILDNAILQNPDSDRLWKAKIELEIRNKDTIVARQLTNKALKAFPASPILWIQYLSLIPKMSQRKTAFLDALKSTSNHPSILMSIGVFFWIDEKYSKAKSWFERSLLEGKNNGDSWAWLYNFTSKYGNENDKRKLEDSFLESFDDINAGEMWNSINKDFKNYDKEPKEILQLVSDRLSKF